MALPHAIAHYLVTLALQGQALTYWQVNTEGVILRSGGPIKKQGLENARAGEYISDHLFYLEGYFPLSSNQEVIPFIQLAPERTIDIHLLTARDEHWVLLLDSTAEMKRQQQLQQKGNELALLQAAYAKLQPIPGISTDSDDEALHTISVLMVALFKSCKPESSVKQAIAPATLNRCFAHISQVIVEEGGLIHHILGETAIALFGLDPEAPSKPHGKGPQSATLQSAAQSVEAAKRLLYRPCYLTPNTLSPAVGLGIVTGEAAVGNVSLPSFQTI
ncbi:MAG: hypothetical protein AAFN12_14805, partial [Cyanobacteria bacterium J06560_2]